MSMKTSKASAKPDELINLTTDPTTDAVSDPSSLPSSLNKNLVTSVLTYVFKEGSPKIQVLLNFIKNKNSGALVNVFTDKNGYTTVTSTSKSTNLNTTADSCSISQNCNDYTPDCPPGFQCVDL